MTKLDRPEDILELLENVKRTGQEDQFQATCPAHNDSTPSLSVKLQNDKILLDCKAGCSTESVVEALGLDMSDLSFNGHKNVKQKQSAKIVETYDYRDKHGELLFQVCRKSNKDFLFRRKVGGDWEWSLKNEDDEYAVDPVLYHLPEVVKAKDQGDRILVVEGEKDADNLRERKLVATCNPMGAGAWKDLHTNQLEGAKVVIIPDTDKEGIEHAHEVANHLSPVAASLKLIEPEELGFDVREDHGKDLSDWLQDDHDKAELLQIVEGTEEWESNSEEKQGRFKDYNEENELKPSKGGRKAEYIELVKDIESSELEGIPEFPKHAVLDIGVIGDYVNWLDDNTEVAPSFAFASYRNLLGLAVGRDYTVRYGGDNHAPIFFDVLIGKTALSRKSNAIKTAHDIIDDTLHTDQEDENFKTIRGVGSAEGMLDAIKASKDEVAGQYAKAALILDEFSTITDKLQQSATQGLSSRIIQLWDLGTNVENITRNDPISIDRPTVSILAGSTTENIRGEIKARAKKGGFFNRFCWWTTSGTDPVPFRDPMPKQVKNDLKKKTRKVIDRARDRESEIWKNLLTKRAKKIWEELYSDFRSVDTSDNDIEDTKTFAIARQPEQTVRHAILFSLFHEENSVRKEDLLRAKQITDYLKKTAFFVLGKFERKETNSCQKRVLKVLRKEGKVQKSTLSSSAAVYCNNGVAQLDRLLEDLESLGHIEREVSD